MAAMARNPSGMMVELTASRPAHGDKVYLSRTRSTSCTSRKASRRSLEEGRTGARIRARVETMELRTARPPRGLRLGREGSHFFPKFGHFFPKTSYVHIYVIRLHTTLMQAFSSHTARASYRKKIHNIIIQTHTHNIHACCILDSYEVFASYDVIHCLHHKPFMYHTSMSHNDII